METIQSLAVVAEEQEFCRAGLAAMLKRQIGFAEVLEARTADQLVAMLAQASAVTLVTVDPMMPGLGGPTAIRELRDQYPAILLVVVSDVIDRASILTALAAGVHGYIPKRYSAMEMLAALRFVAKGHIYVPALLADSTEPSKVAQASSKRLDSSGMQDLTDRQREVVSLVSQGYSNKEIARSLNISPGTVKVHVNGAFRALGVHNRVSAAAAFILPSKEEAHTQPLLTV